MSASELAQAGNGSRVVESVLKEEQVVCYSPMLISMSGIWHGDKPTDFSLPLFMIQLILIVSTTRALNLILKPLRQPRVVAEIVGGVILGPSVLGKMGNVSDVLFPLRGMTVLETMANVGLIFFLFQIGVEMDIGVILRTGRKAVLVSLSGMFMPFITGTVASCFLRNYISDHIRQAAFLLFLGVALSITAFPVLSRILAELKLLGSDLGRLALSASIISDILGWVMLALALALAGNRSNPVSTLGVVVAGGSYVLFCLFALRPAIMWVIRRTPEGEAFDEMCIGTILMGVLLCSFVTDAIGMHAIFGAFTFGLMVPNGRLGMALVERMEDFVAGLMLPLFFAISGLRTDIASIGSGSSLVLGMIIVIGSIGKIGGTIFIAAFYGMPLREGFSLAMLMNTKGVTEMVVLNIGRDKKVLDEEAFAVMVLMAVLLTGTITPVVLIFAHNHHLHNLRLTPYKVRTIQSVARGAELRILACIHTPRCVPTIIHFLEASNPSSDSPIFLYPLHLVELTARATAMAFVNDESTSRPVVDQIINAFNNYEQQQEGVRVQPLTAFSPYSSMHHDVCHVAEEKRVALIILPFHKHMTVDGAMEPTNTAFRTLNRNVLAAAPCSVAILIDRGLAQVSHHIAVLFFGGPDDREALCYAVRMAEHPAVSLTVVRFLESADASATPMNISFDCEDGGRTLTVMTDGERERQADEQVISCFIMERVREGKVVYAEEVVNNVEQTVAVIREMNSVIDLYLVGRGAGMASPLTAGLTDWSECPELGPIGDVLASSDFAATGSVLVVQHCADSAPADEESSRPESSRMWVEQHLLGDSQQEAAGLSGGREARRGHPFS
ncbi:hypothetical protein ACLOJK_012338 [Asimina triloba]